MKQDWTWVTEEQFQQAVEDEAASQGIAWILALPGVYELVQEELHNAVLRRLANENDRCTECGMSLDEDGCCLQQCNEEGD